MPVSVACVCDKKLVEGCGVSVATQPAVAVVTLAARGRPQRGLVQCSAGVPALEHTQGAGRSRKLSVLGTALVRHSMVRCGCMWRHLQLQQKATPLGTDSGRWGNAFTGTYARCRVEQETERACVFSLRVDGMAPAGHAMWTSCGVRTALEPAGYCGCMWVQWQLLYVLPGGCVFLSLVRMLDRQVDTVVLLYANVGLPQGNCFR
jgi:hypothetical protein